MKSIFSLHFLVYKYDVCIFEWHQTRVTWPNFFILYLAVYYFLRLRILALGEPALSKARIPKEVLACLQKRFLFVRTIANRSVWLIQPKIILTCITVFSVPAAFPSTWSNHKDLSMVPDYPRCVYLPV
jgi:hypothetical protein